MSEEARVDLREATGVQVGSGNTQIIYQYDALTWSDGVSRPPIATVTGAFESPYRGLGAYGEKDAPYFFGREQLTTELLERLARAVRGGGNRVVVSGVSGAGKSSLLRAGLLPRLRGSGMSGIPDAAHWPCLFFTPGADPLAELSLQLGVLAGLDAAAIRREAVVDPASLPLTIRQATAAHAASLPELPRGGTPIERRMLLVVDQFEQVFARLDPVHRHQFLKALEAATSGAETPAALLLVGIRADFEARCAELPGFADAVQGRLLVTGMTRRQLRQVITGPANKAGVSVDGALVDALLDEIGTTGAAPLAGAGALPLLSHALDQAWRRRTGADDLTLADYERTGGIEGAVAVSAQACYERLGPDEQQNTRAIFTRLVTVSDGGTDIGRRASRDELAAGRSAAEVARIDEVLDTFARERLLTLAAGFVELSHEAILRSWPLLRDEWLAETRALRAARGRWAAGARLWDDRGRESSYLFRGQSLTEARACADASGSVQPPSPEERDFLGASIAAERRRVSARRALVAALAVVALALGTLAVVATRASSSARHERDIAVAGQLVDDSERAQDSNPHAAAVKALAALRLDPSSQSRFAVAAAAAQPSVAALHVSSDTVQAVTVSPDGSLLAVDADPGVSILASDNLRQVARLPMKQVNDLEFSPDSTTLAIASDGGVQLVDPKTGRVERNLENSTEGASKISYSPDGGTLLGLGYESVNAWVVATGKALGRGPVSGTDFRTVAVSPRGDAFVMAGDAGLSVTVAHGRPIHVPIPDVMDVAFSPDGSQLAVVTFEGRIRLVNTSTWQTSSPVAKVNSGSLLAVTFADHGRLVAGSGSAGIQLWRARDLAAVALPLEGGDGPVNALAADPQRDTLVAGTTLGVLHVWNLAIAAPQESEVRATLPETNSVAVSPDGSTLAVGHRGGSVEILDASTGRRVQLLRTDMQDVEAVDFDPTGQLLTVAGGAESLLGRRGATVEQWSHDGSWHQVRTVEASGPRVASMDVSPTGQYVAVASYDGSVEEWDGTLDRVLWAHRSHSDSAVQAGEVSFDTDGGTLASGDWQGNIQLIDPSSGRTRDSFNQSDGYIDSFSFASDDRRLAVGSSDGRVQLWDTQAHQIVGTPIDTGGVATMSRDGREMFTADSSGIHVWDAATHQQVGRPLIGSDEPITTLALSPDGNTLVTGYADGAVSRWDVSYLADPVSKLCSRPGSTYGESDWRANVPAGPSPRALCPSGGETSA